ncbi:MAG: hypothetical protein NTNFB02_10260 [Nitrospira sp.]
MHDPALFISVKEAASTLGVSTSTIHNYRRLGLIKAMPHPGSRRLKVRRFRLLRTAVLGLLTDSDVRN